MYGIGPKQEGDKVFRLENGGWVPISSGRSRVVAVDSGVVYTVGVDFTKNDPWVYKQDSIRAGRASCPERADRPSRLGPKDPELRSRLRTECGNHPL